MPIKMIPPWQLLAEKSRTPKPFYRKDRLGQRATERYHNPPIENRLHHTGTDRPKTVSFIPSQNRPTHPWIMPNTLEAADYRPDRFIFSLRSANSRIKSAVPSIPSTEESMQRW